MDLIESLISIIKLQYIICTKFHCRRYILLVFKAYCVLGTFFCKMMRIKSPKPNSPC